MADYNRDRSRGNFRGRGFNDRGGGGRSFERPMMHQAVCDKCRKECEVPFRPTSGKPVYCSSCFDRPTSNRPSEGRSFQRPDFERHSGQSSEVARMPNYEQQFAVLNSKLDKILNILMPIAAEAESEVEPEVEDVVEEEPKAPKKPVSKKK